MAETSKIIVEKHYCSLKLNKSDGMIFLLILGHQGTVTYSYLVLAVVVRFGSCAATLKKTGTSNKGNT